MAGELMMHEKQWPFGLRVLLVESNSLYLSLMEHLLSQCDYKVITSCKQVQEAISYVLENQHDIDLIISDAFTPSEDGLLLTLKTVASEFDIPVVFMSWNGETSTLMKFIAYYGACDFLVKPVTMKELKKLWTHVFRKQMADKMKHLFRSSESYTTMSANYFKKRNCDFSSSSMQDDTDELVTDVRHLKKPRLHWTRQLHRQFVAAVNTIGLNKAVPKKIMEIMKVKQLTRDQVASHLQKYKIQMKKLSNSMQGDGVESSSSCQETSLHEFRNTWAEIDEDQSIFLSEVINELHTFETINVSNF